MWEVSCENMNEMWEDEGENGGVEVCWMEGWGRRWMSRKDCEYGLWSEMIRNGINKMC